MVDLVATHPRLVTSPSALHEVIALRTRVWDATGRLAPGAFADGWGDPRDAAGDHLVIEAGDRPIAAVRVVRFAHLRDIPEAAVLVQAGRQIPGPLGFAERLVIDRPFQGTRVFRDLTQGLIRHARDTGLRFLLMECTPEVCRRLAREGHQLLEPAAADARFPGVPFRWVLTDVAAHSR